MIEEIGFEQTYYLLFYRRCILFFLIVVPLVFLYVIMWTIIIGADSYTTIERLLAAKEFLIVRTDAITFASCIYTVGLIGFTISFRRRLEMQNLRKMLLSEEKAQDRYFKDDLWFENRTLKVRGVPALDTSGAFLEDLVKGLLHKENIKGQVKQVVTVPDLYKSLKTVHNIETILDE